MAGSLLARGLLAAPLLWTIVIVLVVVAPALADTIEWTDPNDGTFNDPNNWTVTSGIGSPPPAAGDLVELNEAGTYTITFTQNEASDQLSVSTGDVTLLSDSTTVRQYDLITGSGLATILGGGTLNIGSETNPVFLNGDLMSVGPGGGNGTVVLSGFNSQLDMLGTGTNVIGGFGLTGMFSVTSGATANYGVNGTLLVGSTGLSGTQGIVTVDGASTLNAGHIDIASGNSNTTGTMTVSGAGSLIEQTLAGATLIVGGTGDTGTINVGNNGTFTTSTGATTINAMGTVDIIDGTFNASGPLTMSSGSTVKLDGGSLNADAGLDNSAAGTLDFRDGMLTVTNGPFVPNSGGNFTLNGVTPSDFPHLIVGSQATADFATNLVVGFDRQAQITISDGGEVSSQRAVISNFGGDGTVVVSGTDGNGNPSKWTNSSTLHLGSNALGQNGTGILLINGGGEVSNTAAFIGDNGISGSGIVTVTGSDGAGNPSKWTNSGSLVVGDSALGSLTISSGGEVSSNGGIIGDNGIGTAIISGTDGLGTASKWMNSNTLTIGRFRSGSLTVENGGVVSNMTAFIGFSGQLGSTTGTVDVTGLGSQWTNHVDLYVGGNEVNAGADSTITVQDQGRVEVAGRLKIWTTGTVTLDGGIMDLNGPIEDDGGTFDFISGQLNVNHPSQSALVDVSGIHIGSLINIPAEVDASRGLGIGGSTLIDTASTLSINGGNVSLSGLMLAPGGVLSFSSGSFSSIGGPVQAAVGSTIDIAGGDVSLGDAAAANGFGIAGTLVTGANTVTLLDANDAVFDSLSLLMLGDGASSAGTVLAANGLTLDFGGNITGFGTVDTPDSPATPLINNGNITGDDSNAPITLTGHIKGVGTCDNCNITGTDAPGFSTAAVNRGSVNYNGTLEIEIGGTAAGSGYDQLNHILGAGVADLGGTLDIKLIDGFTPSFGDTFDILMATDVQGTFDVEMLPTLTGALQLLVDYGPTSVSLLVGIAGDFDFDGDVDGSDFLLWQRDPNVGLLSDWEANYGIVAPLSGASAAVPEPSTLALLCLSGLMVLRSFR